MSSDQLLNSEAGPEAQADEILRLLNLEIDAAIRSLQLEAGNGRTAVAGLNIAVEGGEA